MPESQPSADAPELLARDVEAVARIGAVPSILQMICAETGMGFAAVARVTDRNWMACAVHDQAGFGLEPGSQLELRTTLCHESRSARAPIIIDRFSEDADYRQHHTPAIYGLESYISVPIVLPDGEYFGNLCAIDAGPARVSEPRIVRMFEVFSALIGMQLHNEMRTRSAEASLRSERENSALREQFIAVLGHDLRNPLSAISATAELLARREGDAASVRMGQRLKLTVGRMAGLIDDVMDFARGRLGGGFVLSFQSVDTLSTHLGEVVQELQLAHPERTLTSEMSACLPVHGDLRRLQQLLSNLLGNALTHGAADQPVHVRVADEAGDVLISVTNQGEPIPAEMLAQVFEPYWRASSHKTSSGLGLGLFICKQIVDAHRGTLTVSSSREAGTCFTVRIPAARDDEAVP